MARRRKDPEPVVYMLADRSGGHTYREAYATREIAESHAEGLGRKVIEVKVITVPAVWVDGGRVTPAEIPAAVRGIKF
jgi:hypothetical protein